MGGIGRLFTTIAVTAVFSIPLGLSLWALLDCARRPSWAWALSGHHQVTWLALILFGFLIVVGGLVISLIYLLKIRPAVAAAEEGRFPDSGGST